MKKRFPTFLDESAGEYPVISVSAGMRGIQMLVNPEDLEKMTGAKRERIARPAE